MNAQENIHTARDAAARYFRERGYVGDAERIIRGEGDDDAEVRIALAPIAIMTPPPKAPPTKRNGRRLVGEEC